MSSTEERTLDGSLSQNHLPRVFSVKMKTIIRCIVCHKGRNAQCSLVSRHEKGREPYATAQTLPDDILLEIFKYHRLASLRSGPWKWYKLAQVCRRWRFVIFAYPRLLHLRIVMSTKRYSIRKTPNFWPVDLPIILWYRSQLSAKDEKDIFQILKNPARICEIDLDMTSVLLEKCASLLEESFPALECLRLGSEGPANGEALVLPDYFLDSSAPRLRVVRLQNTIFPSLPRLLSTSPNLVSLRLENIPARGIFTAQELAIGLSPATQLESLKINIHGAPYRRQIRPLSEQNGLEPRSVLPALFEFEYEGETLYLNDFASRIDIPNVEQIEATLVNNYDVCLTYGLYGLLARVEDLGSSCRHATHIRFFEETVVFEHHFIRSTTSSPVLFRVRLLNAVFLHDDISFVRSIFSAFQFVGIMHKVTRVEIEGFTAPSRWEVEADMISWLSLFGSISGVKRLHVVGTLVSSLVSALVDISAEEETLATLLPALQDLHLPDKPGLSADIEPFVAARRSYGPPLSVHYTGLRLY